MTLPTLSPAAGGAVRVCLGAVIISFAPLFVKLPDVGPSGVALFRLLWGGLALLCVAVFRKERLVPGKHMFGIMLLAALLFSLDLSTWHTSVIYLGPGLGTILANCQVFFMALAGVFLYKEKLTLRLQLSIPLAFLGLWMLLDVDITAMPPDTGAGLAFGIASAAFYAAYMLTLRQSQSVEDRLPAIANMAVISLMSVGFCGGLALMTGEPLQGISLRSHAQLIGYGVFCQGLGWYMIAKGLPKLPASQAGLIILTQPALSFVWDVVFLDRPTSAVGYCGAVLALAAICLGMLGGQRKTHGKT